ncbi:MAG: TorF family putative porin [Gammaproteobacteria bacterium]
MNFNKSFKLSSLALATSLAFGGAALSTSANAEVGYNATVSSMYLWRGLDVSDGPTISGGVDYSHETGFYASAWASSGLNGSTTDALGAEAYDGYELDLWVGFAGSIGDFGYDISYWDIDYPQFKDGESGNETALGLSYTSALPLLMH